MVREHKGLFEEHPDTFGGQEAEYFDGGGAGGGAESAAGRAQGREGGRPEHDRLHCEKRQGKAEQGEKVEAAEEKEEKGEGSGQKGEGGGAEAEQKERCEEEGKVETRRAKEGGQEKA